MGSEVEELKYNSGDQDFSAQLTMVKSKNPDMFYSSWELR